MTVVDLRTTYMGLELAHPVVASAGPLSRDLDGIRRLEDGGAAAIVLFSLFEEQIEREAAARERLLRVGADSFAESLSYFPEVAAKEVGPDRYLELVRAARAAVQIPVIASLNGTSEGGWIDHAKKLHEAGASAIELNVHFVAADLERSGREVEEQYVHALAAVKRAVPLPVAIKLGPFFSSFGHFARQLDGAGADAIVMFNRFYQPDLDLDRREAVASLELSSASEIRLPLLWLGILHGKLRASLAATTGVETSVEVIKYLAVGADVVMTTSSLLRHGPEHAATLARGLRDWLTAHEYASVAQLRGSMSHQRVSDPTAFERANYLRALDSYAVGTAARPRR
jgi:dihydroorotate dehydrogenase (fumarate)